jgi:ABC-type Fe3+-siderophore transport system permease subunit
MTKARLVGILCNVAFIAALYYALVFESSLAKNLSYVYIAGCVVGAICGVIIYISSFLINRMVNNSSFRLFGSTRDLMQPTLQIYDSLNITKPHLILDRIFDCAVVLVLFYFDWTKPGMTYLFSCLIMGFCVAASCESLKQSLQVLEDRENGELNVEGMARMREVAEERRRTISLRPPEVEPQEAEPEGANEPEEIIEEPNITDYSATSGLVVGDSEKT